MANLRYVPYADEVEVVWPDEDRIADEIIAPMRRIAETTLDRHCHAFRPSRAKSHGLLKGELRLHPACLGR